jgi:thiol:disulfide interchange protein
MASWCWAGDGSNRFDLQYWLEAILAIFLEAVVALALPIYLLYRFRSQAWYWHVLAVIVALVIGLMPGTALLQTLAGSMLYGFVFVFLMIWGIGGLIPFRRLRKKHA